jgi:hypothetical protein
MQETHPDHDKVSLERSTFFNGLLGLLALADGTNSWLPSGRFGVALFAS